jgi:hypothetical protein
MNPVKKIIQLFTFTIASVSTMPGWALPLVFEFTGTISDTVLISGINQTLFTTHPEWNDQQVTGRLTMDFSGLVESPFNGPGYTQYSKNGVSNLTADWMSFLVKNPDSTLLDISDTEPVTPAPEAEGDDAYTDLSYHSYVNGSSGFYAQRSYSNSLTYPQKHASLWLAALGDNADWLTNSADYYDVIIKPEFANWFNYGYVYYYTGSGIGYEYAFTIDSLKRIDISVPEPSTMLIIVGLLMLYIRRHKLFP